MSETSSALSSKICLVLISLTVAGLVAQAEEKPRVIHVIVALCDNVHQGIVPVPEMLGNGENPRTNLYWGAMYGLRTVFDRSDGWKQVGDQELPVNEWILDRRVYRCVSDPAVMLVADAYRGRAIRQAIQDFLHLAGGHGFPVPIQIEGSKVQFPDLVVYVGHNGLMDSSLPKTAHASGERSPGAIVLACKSRDYFQVRLERLGSRQVLMTTGFMAPESYVLEAVLEGWVADETDEQIRVRAATAYNRYQKCGRKAAMRLFVSDLE